MSKLDCQALLECLENIFADYASVAMSTTEYQTVFLKYETLADIGTLPQCSEVTNKYLKLQDGDIVVTNDPYSGGTLLSSPTLIMGIGSKVVKGQTPAEILIASRITLTPRVGEFKTVDDEGLRIPPSPFFIKGEKNSAIIEALKAHPLTQPESIESLLKHAEKLLALRENLKTLMQNSGPLDLNKARLRMYFDATENEFKKRLDDLGEGSSRSELLLSQGQNIKLHVDHLDGHFHFDFSGTSQGDTLFMTDSAVIGVVVGATISLLKAKIPINSGVYRCFDIKAPRGSLVNATFPRSVYLGHTDGLNIFANLVVQGLGGIHKKNSWAVSGPSQCAYQLTFSDGRRWIDQLGSGMGASERFTGLSGINLWSRTHTNCSVEKIENLYPVQILNSGLRANSAGEGRYSGGQGVVRSIKLNEDADLHWCFASPPHKPEGIHGGKAAMGAEIVHQNLAGEKLELANSGHLKIKKGEVITVMSAGGGGYGIKI